MKKLLPIGIATVSIVFVLLTIVSGQQLTQYANQIDATTKISAAGGDGLSATCQQFHLPTFARLFDIITLGAFISLLLLAGLLVARKRIGLNTTIVRALLGVLIVGLIVMIVYQFVDPLYPFALCRGLLP